MHEKPLFSVAPVMSELSTVSQQVTTRGQLCTAFGLNFVGTGELWRVTEQGSDLVKVCVGKINLVAREQGKELSQKV